MRTVSAFTSLGLHRSSAVLYADGSSEMDTMAYHAVHLGLGGKKLTPNRSVLAKPGAVPGSVVLGKAGQARVEPGAHVEDRPAFAEQPLKDGARRRAMAMAGNW